ncbi:hypothetical protein BVY01_03955, partial [bacterium I07]
MTSLDVTENHVAVKSQIAEKRDRSYKRSKGFTNFQHILSSLKKVDLFVENGQFIGSRPAFNLNQQIFDDFLKRLIKAYLYIENNVEKNKMKIRWSLS